MHSALGLTDRSHREEAVKRLQCAITEAPAVRVRQRVFNLAWLATCHLADGDTTAGTTLGSQALDAVRDLRSVRILDHLAPLQAQAERYARDTDAVHLAHEIHRLRTSA
jgi:hypothetical protein